jgi:hypothetical protein
MLKFFHCQGKDLLNVEDLSSNIQVAGDSNKLDTGTRCFLVQEFRFGIIERTSTGTGNVRYRLTIPIIFKLIYFFIKNSLNKTTVKILYYHDYHVHNFKVTSSKKILFL